MKISRSQTNTERNQIPQGWMAGQKSHFIQYGVRSKASFGRSINTFILDINLVVSNFQAWKQFLWILADSFPSCLHLSRPKCVALIFLNHGFNKGAVIEDKT